MDSQQTSQGRPYIFISAILLYMKSYFLFLIGIFL